MEVFPQGHHGRSYGPVVARQNFKLAAELGNVRIRACSWFWQQGALGLRCHGDQLFLALGKVRRGHW